MTEPSEPPSMWPMRVRAYRVARGWTQQELAERFGRSVRTVKRWESGEVLPSAAEQEAIMGEMEQAA